MNEEELQAFLKVSRAISKKYTFGFYDKEDIEQECYFLALEALEKYDSNLGSLENFLYSHLNNRLKNFLRKHYYRKTFTCIHCGGKDPECPSCMKRKLRFATKKHLIEPIDIDHVNCNHESNAYETYDFLHKMELHEIFSIIDQNLDIQLRADYLRMLEGLHVPKPKRELIEQRIVEILEEHGYGE